MGLAVRVFLLGSGSFRRCSGLNAIPLFCYATLAVCLAGSSSAAAQNARLVLISVDGLRPDVITAADTPNMAALRDGGASAADALNDLPSATLPNHTTMLTGLVGDRHGVVLNFELPGTVAFPTLFDFAHESGLRSAFFASKSKLKYLAPPDVLETVDIDGETGPLVDRLIEQISPDGPDLIFVHLRDPDSAGHAGDWLSEVYFDAVRAMDALVGEIVAAIEADTSRESYIILTADHGGSGTNHFLNIPENRMIPWIVWGPGIQAATTLKAAISIADTTPTALWLLGAAVPEGLSGVARREVRDAADDPVGGQAVPPVGLPCLILIIPGLFIAHWAAARCGLSLRR